MVNKAIRKMKTYRAMQLASGKVIRRKKVTRYPVKTRSNAYMLRPDAEADHDRRVIEVTRAPVHAKNRTLLNMLVEHEQGHVAHRQLRERIYGEATNLRATKQDAKIRASARKARSSNIFLENTSPTRYLNEFQAWRYGIAGQKMKTFDKKVVHEYLGSYAKLHQVKPKVFAHQVELLSRYHRRFGNLSAKQLRQRQLAGQASAAKRRKR